MKFENTFVDDSFEKQALIVAYPHDSSEWGGFLKAAQSEFLFFVQKFIENTQEKLICFVPPSATQELKDFFNQFDNIRYELLELTYSDIWLRDLSPKFFLKKEKMQALCFDFNSYGNKFQLNKDSIFYHEILKRFPMPSHWTKFILEGGAFEFGKNFEVFSTCEAVLNKNRNPNLEKEELEKFFQELGIKDGHFFERGLLGDHTDGHVDNLLRVHGKTLLAASAPQGHPQYFVCEELKEKLPSNYEVHFIELPDERDSSGEVLPLSYLNYVFFNGVVFLPVFNEAVFDEKAIAVFQKVFAGAVILPCPSRNITEGGGGSLHCMSVEIPNFIGDN